MRLTKLVFIALSGLLALFFINGHVFAMDHTKPQLQEDKNYKEYWEQHFLFEDGTFVTSQFLVANFPWPVGKDHGIMIATVVNPDGKRTIIKNGRNLGEWGFNPEKFDIFIHTHRLSGQDGKNTIYLGADDKNEIDVKVTSQISPQDFKIFDDADFKDEDAQMNSAIYLPYFKGEGSWRILKNIDQNEEQIFETGKGKVQGFGTHVLINGDLEDVLTNWLRVSGLSGADQQPIPFLSSIIRPDGEKDIILTLLDKTGKVTKFSDVTLEYKDIIQEDKKTSYPTVIVVKANNDHESLRGTIHLNKKIDHFNINDHLNFFEKGFASSRASVANYRYIADYDFKYNTAAASQRLTGKALSEYQDILPPSRAKKIRKRKRKN